MADTNTDEPVTISVWPEAANILGIGKDAAYQAAERGEIPAVRIGRRWRVARAALYRMLENPRPPKEAA